VINRKT